VPKRKKQENFLRTTCKFLQDGLHGPFSLPIYPPLLSILTFDQKLPALPTLATVENLIVNEKQGNCVPVYVELPADLITPCMAYLRVSKDSKYSFLLESVLGAETVSRYTFIGAGKLQSNRNPCTADLPTML
jgi:hypothetical protein